jgi:antitoxin (DNA-binding transcriptional repressor) of toxin-antitoxin stability system
MQIAMEVLAIDTEELLQAIQQDEPIMLMYHGKPQAKIIGLNVTDHRRPNDLSQSPLFGIWQDRPDCQDVQAYVDELRRSRVPC